MDLSYTTDTELWQAILDSPIMDPSDKLIKKLRHLPFDFIQRIYPGFPFVSPDGLSTIAEETANMDLETTGVSEIPENNFTVIKNTVKSAKRPQSPNNDVINEFNPAIKIAKTFAVSSATTKPINTKNKFSALSSNVLLNDKSLPNTSENLLKSAKRISVPKVRPITIKLNSEMKSHQFLKDLATNPHCNFQAAPAGEFLKIYPKEPVNYKHIIDKLDELKVQHYLIPEKSALPLKVVIRGLGNDVEPTEIANSLMELNYTPIKVNHMSSFKTGKFMPLYQVHLDNNDKNKTIFELTSLMYHIIAVEPYQRPKRTLQCFRCQFYHHSSQNCRMQPRCCTCSGNHERKDCPHLKEQIDKPKCCNCGGSHTSSYRGCPKFPENIKRNTFTSNKTNQNFSYASVVNSAQTIKNIPKSPASPQPTGVAQTTSAPAPSTAPQNSFSALNDIFNLIAQEFGHQNFNDLLNYYKNVLIRIQNCSSPQEKFNILLEILGQNSSLLS